MRSLRSLGGLTSGMLSLRAATPVAGKTLKLPGGPVACLGRVLGMASRGPRAHRIILGIGLVVDLRRDRGALVHTEHDDLLIALRPAAGAMALCHDRLQIEVQSGSLARVEALMRG